MSGGYFQPWIINFSAVKFFALKTLFKRASAKFKLTIFKLTFKLYGPFLLWGPTASRLNSHFKEEVPRKSTLEPPHDFERGTAEYGIQHLNHSTIAP